MSLLRSMIQPLINFLKWIFSCGSTSSIKTDKAPEISPGILSSYDPFRCHVFTNDLTFKSQEGFEAAVDLFQQLGTGSFWHWITHQSELNGKEQKIKDYVFHPLEMLYFLFCNRTLTSYMVNFQKESSKGSWFLKIKTGRSPWEEFLNKNGINFDKRKGTILSLIPGFCKALGLNEQTILSLANDEKWEELISSTFEQRKKHFNL